MAEFRWDFDSVPRLPIWPRCTPELEETLNNYSRGEAPCDCEVLQIDRGKLKSCYNWDWALQWSVSHRPALVVTSTSKNSNSGLVYHLRRRHREDEQVPHPRSHPAMTYLSERFWYRVLSPCWSRHFSPSSFPLIADVTYTTVAVLTSSDTVLQITTNSGETPLTAFCYFLPCTSNTADVSRFIQRMQMSC